MGKLKEYSIEFKRLKDGVHHFEFLVDAAFFGLFENALYEDAQTKVQVNLTKSQQMLILDFSMEGSIVSLCDYCLEPLNVAVDHESRIYVKFGSDYDEPSEDIVVLPRDEHALNVAQLIYDLLVTSLPIKHVHPIDESGRRSCNPEMVQKLSEYLVEDAGEADDDTDSDPRWDELKKLIDKHK